MPRFLLDDNKSRDSLSSNSLARDQVVRLDLELKHYYLS